MSDIDIQSLTERQRRELEYHKTHAEKNSQVLSEPFSYDVLDRPERRWWNAYWSMYDILSRQNLRGKSALVVGCGFGNDALRMAKLGARVSAFDLSAESLNIAEQLADRENLQVEFSQMPAEDLRYPSGTFDVVVIRDILHHVDIEPSMAELRRVAKPGGLIVINEIYSHSLTDNFRNSALVTRFLYPKMRRMIYGADDPYITADERKLTERDLSLILTSLGEIREIRYFNFLVNRLIPDSLDIAAKGDRMLLSVIGSAGKFIAGRLLLTATFPCDAGTGRHLSRATAA